MEKFGDPNAMLSPQIGERATVSPHENVDPWIGRTLSGVRLDSLLSEGGMGRVYSGWFEAEDRRVAVKVLKDRMRMNPFFMRQFQKEANAIVGLDHPGIVRCVDCRMARGRPYFVMDLIEGLPLNALIQSLSRQGLLLPLHLIARIIESVAAGLDHAHQRGVLHLDIKPGNIILQSDSMQVKPDGPIPPDLSGVLTDFGLARMGSSLKRSSSPDYFMGTPGYASPQLILGEDLDRRADGYSLGAILFELLAGDRPFIETGDDPVTVLRQQLHDPVPQIDGISRELNDLLRQAMAKDPADRPGTAGIFAEQLTLAIQLETA